MGFLVRILSLVVGATAVLAAVLLLIRSVGPDDPSAQGDPVAGLTGSPAGSEAGLSAARAPAAQPAAATVAPSGATAASVGADPFEAFVAEQAATDRFGADAALRRNYPADHQRLMRDLFDARQAGADARDISRRRNAYLAALLREKIQFAPFAGEGALRAYFTYNLRVLAGVRDTLGADACGDVTLGGRQALAERLRATPSGTADDLITLLGAQTGMILDVAREGERAGARTLEPPQGADWRTLYRSMERLGATSSQIGQFQQGAPMPPEEACAVTIAYYEALLGLEGDSAARLHPIEVRKLVGGG